MSINDNMAILVKRKNILKCIDNYDPSPYNKYAVCADGGVAQLARAFGSYPTGHRFKSSRRYHAGRTDFSVCPADR